MNRQYYAPRRRGGQNPHGVGTVPIGTIVYLQNTGLRIGRNGSPVCVVPWIVEAWLPREYHPAVRGRPSSVYIRGGHLAIVRSLRDRRVVRTVADHLLLSNIDAGFEVGSADPGPIPITPAAARAAALAPPPALRRPRVARRPRSLSLVEVKS